MLTSKTFSQTGVLAMLQAMMQEKGGSSQWGGDTVDQRWITQMLQQGASRVSDSTVPFQALAGRSSQELNSFLQDLGCGLTVPEFGPPHIGGAAVYEADIRFARPGVVETLQIEGTPYPSVTMYKGVRTWNEGPFSTSGTPRLAQIRTTGDEEVYLIPCTDQLSGMGLLQFVLQQVRAKSTLEEEESGLRFPMAHLSQRLDLRFMHGMELGGHQLHVALQENSVALDHLGARVRSGSAGVAYLGLAPAIQTPYVFAVVQDGLVHFAALLAQDSWCNPADGTPLELSGICEGGFEEVPEYSFADDPLTEAEKPVVEPQPSREEMLQQLFGGFS
jgi:hypothetical protein